jgi:uncharacterized protein (TIGR00299 family) protein
MKIAYFDCFAGISGDMALGALLDCGVPLEKLREGLSLLPVAGWEISSAPVLKSGIHAQQVRIALHGQSDAEELAASTREAHHAHEHAHHEHSHEESAHRHEHAHSHEHTHQHSHEHHHGRSMREIREIIESSGLSERVKGDSLKIFSLIAQAEAKMHHSTPDDVHFHEIGGIDSLLDICGVAWCLEYLGVEEIHCSALPNFSGSVVCAHGTMPLPAPATLELLRGVPLVPSGLRGEMVTPTGAAIVAALAQSFDAPPTFSIDVIGAGAGTKNWPDRPNFLRVILGEKSEAASTREKNGAVENAGLEWRTLSHLETNIDDMNPEFFSFVLERLFDNGALDAWLEPVQMKKNRPATLLRVLARPEDQESLVALMLRDTTSLGVRVSQVRRGAMARREYTVTTCYGDVNMKEAAWKEGGILRFTPEYEDVALRARQHNVSAREVYQAAEVAATSATAHETAQKT